MPFDFFCPHCGARSQVAEQLAGHKSMCQQCGQTVQYPVLGQGATVVMPQQRSMLPWIILILVGGGFMMMCVIGILIALLLPAVQAAREAARRTMCSNNLKQIAMALDSYQLTHGSYPPAYIADENGKPLHSWRVLILPFMNHEALYDQYDFNEPWDGPKNQALAHQMPPEFRCPSANSPPGCTSYVGSMGAGKFFDPARTIKPMDIADGLSNTITVVEIPHSQVSWLDPLDGQTAGVQPFVPGGKWSGHPRGMNVSFADGSVQFIEEDTDPAAISAMQSIDGKEEVAEFDFSSP